MTKTVIYLGPKGSYSNLAIDKFKNCFSESFEPIEGDSIYQIIQFLKSHNADNVVAVVPVENSVEGIVRETQDNLAELVKYGYRIFAETTLTIEHSLIGFGTKDEIELIASHPQALAQCKGYICQNWGDKVALESAFSTSAAVRLLQKGERKRAAIGSKFCADLYNIPVIETNVNDENNNTTRFILLSNNSPQKGAFNKVSITFSTENKPGALCRVLNVFEQFNINLSYIDSRPSRRELGEYVFYADFDGHLEDENISQALEKMRQCTAMLEILSVGAVCF